MQVLDEIVARGASPEHIRVLSITVAPPALKQLSEKYPGGQEASIPIFSADGFAVTLDDSLKLAVLHQETFVTCTPRVNPFRPRRPEGVHSDNRRGDQ